MKIYGYDNVLTRKRMRTTNGFDQKEFFLQHSLKVFVLIRIFTNLLYLIFPFPFLFAGCLLWEMTFPVSYSQTLNSQSELIRSSRQAPRMPFQITWQCQKQSKDQRCNLEALRRELTSTKENVKGALKVHFAEIKSLSCN